MIHMYIGVYLGLQPVNQLLKLFEYEFTASIILSH
jgi:hypothetical protein